MRRIVKPNQSSLTPEQNGNLKDGRGLDDKKFSLHHYLFDKQFEFVQNTSPFKIAVCSRRAGKTVACAAHLLDVALKNPGVQCIYITLTMKMARALVKREIDNILRVHKIKAEYNITENQYELPNGSFICLSGANNRNEIEKFRGRSKVKIVYLDECQSFPSYIEELVNDVLAPSLIDVAGDLVMIGTPGPVPNGYFHKCYNSPEWAQSAWTFWDNPHIPNKDKMFARELKRRGVDEQHPSIRREWFGEWALDESSLLVHYSAALNNFDSVPLDNSYQYLLGIDVGFNDADALAILAWSERSSNIYLVEEVINKNQDVTHLVQQIQVLRSKYNISKCVIDTGGLGKKIAEEIVRRHAIPLVAADKVRKMENIKLLNDYLRSGRFKASDGSMFAKDSFKVEIDWEHSTPDKIKVSNRYHSDIIDAVLYAFKECYAYTYQKAVEKPKYGTPEWFSQEEEDMYQNAYEAALKAHENTSDDPY